MPQKHTKDTLRCKRSFAKIFVLLFLLFHNGLSAQELSDPGQEGTFSISPYFYEPATQDPSDPLRTDVFEYFTTPDFRVKETMDNVPVRGIGHFPEGNGPFPLVLIFHGNHHPLHPSHEGYEYLTRLLASHGMICISIDGNFLNGGVFGEMDARAILLLRHLQRWRQWNGTSGHPFYQKVDIEKIGLAGHSRGGEAVTVANLYNKSLHDASDPLHNFAFRIQSLYAIAPVDGQIGSATKIVIEDADYFFMHGSHDGDVSWFSGQKTYDRAFPKDTTARGFKGLLFVHGANHNFWNHEWEHTNDTTAYGVNSPLPQISIAEQQDLAKVYMSAFFQWTLLEKPYKELFTSDVSFATIPQNVTVVQQYSDPKRLDLNNYEEDHDSATGSFPGVNNAPRELNPFQDNSLGNFPWNKTAGVIAGWKATNAGYEITLPTAIGDVIDEYPYLSLRIGQVFERSPVFNPKNEDKNLSLQLELGKTQSHILEVSGFATLPYPVEVFQNGSDKSKSVMQTVRIPLRQFVAGKPDWKLVDITSVHIRFDRSNTGLVVFDDIQLTE